MTSRIWLIDMARSVALLGMVSFHLVYDLQMFGLVPPGTAANGWFYLHARLVAGSFLALAGVGVWLSHGDGIRWMAFWRRLAVISAAAALVTVATYLALPDFYVFFGILHCIALSSLLGLLFLRLPALVTIAVGLGVIAASYVLPPLVALDVAALRFVGLHNYGVNTVDFEPLLPWFGPFLIGLGASKALAPWWPRLSRIRPTGLWAALAVPGRHSLAIYLIHQPILFGLIWLYAQTRS